MNNPVLTPAGLIATLCGIGKVIKKGSGTAGSAIAVVAAVFLPTNIRIGVIAALIVIGVWASGAYEKVSGTTDPGEVIIDEVVGMLIATLWHIAGTGSSDITARFAIPCFILFRFFDILKPWPVDACERLTGGWGIMADDIAGGILANVLLILLRKFFIEGWMPF